MKIKNLNYSLTAQGILLHHRGSFIRCIAGEMPHSKIISRHQYAAIY